eukprot:CAMPEP_0181316892 /NCGR_PEP_ID=MMETSP1101-20121128/16137_1 /TAXON_ID=46948 /ORGANISM="Rhodomonas abbreviata, Strain Caron Lab Isolate" /LENGTH=314 /DNA_ID=CAMNT_0023424169 /DNA_START=52 /DNA_END=993 /DNA_ORIENTATION=+
MAGLLARVLGNSDPLVVSAVAIAGMHVVGYVVGVGNGNRKLADLLATGSMVASAATTCAVMVIKCGERGERVPARPLILTGVVTVWGLRLCTHLGRRVQLADPAEDSSAHGGLSHSASKCSLSDLAVSPGEFPPRCGGGLLSQVAWSYAALLPLTLSCRFPLLSPSLDIATFLSLGGCVAGVAIETVADRQKSASKAMKGQEAMWCEEGLWFYSRHPNYFGECVLWSSCYLVAARSLPAWAAAAPSFVVLWVYNFTAGELESRYDDKFKANSDYSRYKWDTSLLLPLPKSSSSMPRMASSVDLTDPEVRVDSRT